MSWIRAALIIASASLVGAAAVAVVARTPAAVRSARPPPSATDPGRGADFTDEQIARHGAYNEAGYGGFLARLAIGVVTLLVLARGPVTRLGDALAGVWGGWVVGAAALAVIITGVVTVANLPLGYVLGFANQHAWELSTQDLGGWISDRLRGLLVGVITSAIAAVAFIGVVRWQPRWWPVWGWGAFTGLTVLFVFLWPLVVAPLFNRFSPLADGSLRSRALALASEAGVPVNDVLVADASKRTTAENAYVAGLGASRRLVLYDTLATGATEDEAAFVIAHELGHEVERHVVKNVVVASLGLAAGFAALAWLAGRSAIWEWGGASGIGDVRALPLLLLFVTAANLVALPIESAVSRRFETRADEIAVEHTDDPATAVGAFRRLAFKNISDLRPPAVARWVLFSHPPIPERIERALAARSP
jgi:STE24 endopeptidase